MPVTTSSSSGFGSYATSGSESSSVSITPLQVGVGRTALCWAKKRRTRLGDIRDQLAALRQRVARINRKYAAPTTAPRASENRFRPARYFVEEWLSGEEVTTAH